MENNNNFNNFTNLTHFEGEALNNNVNNNFNNNFNNLNFYNENANIAIEEFLNNIPENVDSDDYFACTIQDERIYTLLKGSTYYEYFKKITGLIQKLRNLIVGNTKTFKNNLDDFNKLKLYIINVLRNLNSYLNNYKDLYLDFKIDEKTGNISDEDTASYFVYRLLLIKDELLLLPKKIFPILYNYENSDDYENLNENSIDDKYKKHLIFNESASENLFNTNNKNSNFDKNSNLFSSEDENSDESSSLFSKKDEDLNKGFNNNIKSNKNSSLKNNKIGLEENENKIIIPVITNIKTKNKNNYLIIFNNNDNTSKNNINLLNKKIKRNSENFFSNNPPSFWRSKFLIQFKSLMKRINTLQRKGQITLKKLGEIKKLLYDNSKAFYDYLCKEGKVDAYGNIIKSKLNPYEKEKYDSLIANKEELRNKYFPTKNRNNLPYFFDSEFGKEFMSLKIRVKTYKLKLKRKEKIPTKLAKNLGELDKKTNNLLGDAKKFYNKLCEQKKVNREGNVIEKDLNTDEKQEYDKLKTERKNIIKTYFPSNTKPFFGSSKFGRDFINLKSRCERLYQKNKKEEKISEEVKSNLKELPKTINDLYDKAKNFFNKLRENNEIDNEDNIDKIDNEGNVIEKDLNPDEKQEYNNLKTEKENIFKTYFPSSTKPYYDLSTFKIEFRKLNGKAKRLNKKKENLPKEKHAEIEDVTKTTKQLDKNGSELYYKLRENNKVDNEGNVIEKNLNPDEKQEYNNLNTEIQKQGKIINNLMKTKKNKKNMFNILEKFKDKETKKVNSTNENSNIIFNNNNLNNNNLNNNNLNNNENISNIYNTKIELFKKSKYYNFYEENKKYIDFMLKIKEINETVAKQLQEVFSKSFEEAVELYSLTYKNNDLTSSGEFKNEIMKRIFKNSKDIALINANEILKKAGSTIYLRYEKISNNLNNNNLNNNKNMNEFKKPFAPNIKTSLKDEFKKPFAPKNISTFNLKNNDKKQTYFKFEETKYSKFYENFNLKIKDLFEKNNLEEPFKKILENAFMRNLKLAKDFYNSKKDAGYVNESGVFINNLDEEEMKKIQKFSSNYLTNILNPIISTICLKNAINNKLNNNNLTNNENINTIHNTKIENFKKTRYYLFYNKSKTNVDFMLKSKKINETVAKQLQEVFNKSFEEAVEIYDSAYKNNELDFFGDFKNEKEFKNSTDIALAKSNEILKKAGSNICLTRPKNNQ